MIKDNERMEYLQYRSLCKGFYEVYGVTDFDKIAIEGEVCTGILLKLMEQTTKDKGKIVKVKSKSEWDFKTNTKKIKNENLELKKELKKYKERIFKIRRLSKH